MDKGKERVFKSHGLTLYHQNFPKKQLKEHSHQEAHLFIPLQGSITLIVDDVSYQVKSGQMMFIGGSVEHSFSSESEMGERLILQIEKVKFKSKVSILPVNQLLLNTVLNLFNYPEESFSKTMVSLVNEILISDLTKEKEEAVNDLFKTQQKILTAQNALIKKIVSLLPLHLESGIGDIASATGLSHRSLSRLTREHLGLTPNELHTFYRIQKATELIFEGKLSLTEVAFECGYNSLSQFIQNFKKWTGSRPSDFKTFQ
ncbi:MAG: helix-turn-helix domain-containing protein [Bacteriovoracia bacterium]